MRAKQNHILTIVILLTALFMTTVACTAREVMCQMTGGDWQKTSTGYDCRNKSKDYVELMESGPVINSDGEDVAVARPAAPDPGAEPAQESASQPQPESDAGEGPQPADEAPPALATIASCIPQPGEYKIEMVNVNDRTSGSGDKRVCGANGTLTNNSGRDLMFAAYRVHNYGGHNYEKWTTPGYQTLYHGDMVEFAEFYRCTGKACGDDGAAWFYFDKVSILYKTDECLDLAFSYEDKIPESIIPVENPCSW